MGAAGRVVRVRHRVRDVVRVQPALEGPLQERVPQRQREVLVGDREVGHPAPGEGDGTDQGVALVPPGLPQGPARRPLQARPERLGPLGRRQLGRAGAQRVVEPEGPGHQAVHGEEVADDPGDGRLAAHLPVLLVPLEPHRRVPLGLADVPEQRVEPGGLRVVRRDPAGDRDAGGAAAQAVLQDAGAQQRVEVQVAVAVEQGDGVAQPQRLVGARAALGEVRLDGRGLPGGARRERPGPEEGLEHAVGEDGHVRLPLLHRLFLFPLVRGPSRQVRVVVRRPAGARYAGRLRDAVRVVVRPGHGVRPGPGGEVPSSGRVFAVESSWRPSRRRRRASSSVTPRSAAVWR